MHTLHVVAAPRDLAEELPLRVQRILGEVDLILADDLCQARGLLTASQIETPLIAAQMSDQPASVEPALMALETGDVALLWTDVGFCPSEPCRQILRAAFARGYSVAAVPGPNSVITTLVVSGLPTDSFVYLGQLPGEPEARCALLASVAQQRRTLVALELPQRLPDALLDLHHVLGDRPLAVFAPALGIRDLWRGSVVNALEAGAVHEHADSCTLVIGGARETAEPWDERRLRTEIQSKLRQGDPAREISRQLARESGWPRREIYRQAVDLSKSGLDR